MNLDWSEEIVEQISRADRALSSSARPGAKLTVVLDAGVAILEGEGGLIEIAPGTGAMRALSMKRGLVGKISPECLAHVMQSGRSVAPPALDCHPRHNTPIDLARNHLRKSVLRFGGQAAGEETGCQMQSRWRESRRARTVRLSA